MSSVSSAAFEQRLLALTDLAKSLTAYVEEDMVRAFQLDTLIRTAPSYMGGGKELGSFLKLLQFTRKTDAERSATNGKGDGVVILVFAGISVLLCLTRRYKGLWLTGAGSIARPIVYVR